MDKEDFTEILVTGASGYLGCHIVYQLLRKGYRVRASVRDLSDKDTTKKLRNLCPNAKFELKLVQADLQDLEAWQKAVEGCTHVIHTASLFPTMNAQNKEDEDEYTRKSSEGTLALLSSCQIHRIKRFILTSCSTVIHGDFIQDYDPERIYSEVDRADPTNFKDVYFKSKRIVDSVVEQYVNQLPEEERFELTILHPVRILGPTLTARDTTTFTLLRQLMENEMNVIPRRNMWIVDVRDVASAHVTAATLPEAAGERYIIATQSVSILNMAGILDQEFMTQGYKISTSVESTSLLWFKSWFSDKACQSLTNCYKNIQLNNSKMRNILKLNPINIDRTIIETVYSLIEKGFIKKTSHFQSKPISFSAASEHMVIVEENRSVLLRCLDCNVHLLSCLTAEEIISHKLQEEIECEKPHTQRNDKLLDWLAECSYEAFQHFIRIVRKCDQEHVANLLTNNKTGKWPLKEEIVRRLRRIKPKMIKIIDSFSGLIDYMASFGVVSDVDVDKIKSKKTSCKQNAAIVDAVLRRSEQDFENFKTALKKTNQKHVAEFLVEGEVTGVHFNTSCPERDGELSESLNRSLLSQYEYVPDAYTEVHRCNGFVELFQNEVFIIGSEPSRSIVVYFYFKTAQALQYLMDAVDRGNLGTIMEDIFSNVELGNENLGGEHPTASMDASVRTVSPQGNCQVNPRKPRLVIRVETTKFDEEEEEFCNKCITKHMHLDESIEESRKKIESEAKLYGLTLSTPSTEPKESNETDEARKMGFACSIKKRDSWLDFS